jgi:hypothetical protein
MKYAVEMASCGMAYLPSSMKIDTVVQEILRFCFRNLRGCKVGIIGWRDLRMTPLRWDEVP